MLHHTNETAASLERTPDQSPDLSKIMNPTPILPALVHIGKTKFHCAMYKTPQGLESSTPRGIFNGILVSNELIREATTEWIDSGNVGTLYQFETQILSAEESQIMGVVELSDGRFDTFPVEWLKRVEPTRPQPTVEDDDCIPL